ncbi:Zn-dependent hydrolase [Zafaria cholistanensis]|uniref:Zn-dependent hydrolase n=1 Tax=Zafaria cholistanensis TaxID=1682741 RepID=A0A5A7NS18_9MICC|nr:allantoate amidohydrolase [Zafaria cholistanensis]GER22598.1 Zn-dependent hydrolase [Zafaria cholistanensis]
MSGPRALGAPQAGTAAAGGTPGPTPRSLEAAARIMARCEELAAISAMDGGIERTYLTPEHAAHNALAAGWMAEAGLATWQDAAGNQCGRLEGSVPGLPALLLASHLDTVPDAGKYDGILGVLIAIEAAARLRERARELPFAIETVAFGDEEGTRFGATLLGSRALAGTWNPDWFGLKDAHGTTLEEAFRAFGLDPGRVGEAARRPGDLAGYLEVHIEQGPRLEEAGRALAAVTSIAGARRFHLTVTGEARHTGGTPYAKRRDALIGASRAVLDIVAIARAEGAIATVGQFQAFPGAVNVVPGRVEFSLDLRARSDGLRDRVWGLVREAVQAFCRGRNLELSVREIHSAPTVPCAPRLMEAVRAGIRATGDAEPMELYSKAGHDAMAVAAVTDMAMLFVRCEDGISHAPDEKVALEDVAVALDAFEAAVLAAARG